MPTARSNIVRITDGRLFVIRPDARTAEPSTLRKTVSGTALAMAW
jgi:hypothetical protein